MKKIVLCGSLTVLCGLIFKPALAAPGVTEREILLGTATNLKGRTAGIAEEFNSGIEAYINKINRSGGIYGRKLRRIVYNDSYEPERTLVETRRLIDRDRVFALIGYASTPGVKKVLPLISDRKIPLIAPYSGAKFLREAKQKFVFNIKAGYSDQVETLTKLAVYSLGYRDICIFGQADALGHEAHETMSRTLQKYNLSVHAQSEYERNSMNIQPAMAKLKDAGCKAIMMASQDRQAREFITLANSSGFHPLYLCLNLIGTQTFLDSVRPFNEKIFVAVVTPLPSETAYPIVREFRKNLSVLNPKARSTPTALEGYLVGAVLEEALKSAGRGLTRASLASAFESLKDTNISGVNFTFNMNNRQATNRVLITKAEGEQLELIP